MTGETLSRTAEQLFSGHGYIPASLMLQHVSSTAAQRELAEGIQTFEMVAEHLDGSKQRHGNNCTHDPRTSPIRLHKIKIATELSSGRLPGKTGVTNCPSMI
jgi:hypothetical protein